MIPCPQILPSAREVTPAIDRPAQPVSAGNSYETAVCNDSRPNEAMQPHDLAERLDCQPDIESDQNGVQQGIIIPAL